MGYCFDRAVLLWGAHVEDELATARMNVRDELQRESRASKKAIPESKQAKRMADASTKALKRVLSNEREHPPAYDPFMTVGDPI